MVAQIIFEPKVMIMKTLCFNIIVVIKSQSSELSNLARLQILWQKHSNMKEFPSNQH